MTNHPISDLRPGAVAVVLGTRPEIVKLAHVIRLLGPAARIVHTGQHYDERLSEVFLHAFGLSEPDVHIGVGGKTRGGQIGATVTALDAYLDQDAPQVLVVQGDTNASLAGAVAANAREIPLVHVEAGLRSFDRRMPEEHNRVLTDHLADLLCAPTKPGLNVGVFAEPLWRKNVTTQLLAVAMLDGARAHVMRKPGVSYLAGLAIEVHGELPWDRFIALQSSVDLNLYVTLSECHPSTPQESYLAGVPCLVSRVSSVFRDDPVLWDLTSVDEADNPSSIARGAMRLMEAREEAVSLGDGMDGRGRSQGNRGLASVRHGRRSVVLSTTSRLGDG